MDTFHSVFSSAPLGPLLLDDNIVLAILALPHNRPLVILAGLSHQIWLLAHSRYCSLPDASAA